MENNQFVTDVELTSYINNSLSELDDLLISRYEDYKLSTASGVITIAQDGYNKFALPADFLKLRGCDRQVDGDAHHFMTMQRFGLQERNKNAYPVLRAAYGSYSLLYRVEGRNIVVVPADNSAATYRVWYVPQYILLVAPSDTLQPYMDTQAWCEYAIVDVSIKVLAKQNLDPSIFMAQKDALIKRVEAMAANLDAGSAAKTVDTRHNNLNAYYNQGRYGF
jgi:hypothetical protein